MEYYIQGNPERAAEIKAAFERNGIDTSANSNYGISNLFYFSCNGEVAVTQNRSTINIIKTHPDYKELELRGMTMTREEQIKKAAHDFSWGWCDDMAHPLNNGFIKGAEWADQHPQWIHVEEELPPLHYEGANSTDFVLIWDGDDVLIAYYDFKEKKWYNEEYGALIIPATHWMPIVPPRKEDKQ